MNKIIHFVWELVKIIVVTLVIVLPVRYFLFQPFIVRGQSMEPNFHNSDYLIVDEITYRFQEPKRGEVVVFKSQDASSYLIKRIIGLPGETIEIMDDQVKIYNQENPQGMILDETEYLSGNSLQTPGEVKVLLAEDEYFVLGDNRLASYDSRRWGPLSREDIVGKFFLRAWPVNGLAKFELPEY